MPPFYVVFSGELKCNNLFFNVCKFEIHDVIVVQEDLSFFSFKIFDCYINNDRPDPPLKP